ncbi:spore coat putative kinase YutH [Schinkia azotoformans]|uniref:spore coat putative kinase YutH n=1 Tax=Schinkia azotoformans TaxID=1454 RepID=UPI002DBF2E6E|nr:spore coat protein YutH [Schinkia azotoformans]MEC1773180.1 spore coat protein YutH [Schinkia azotoformans]MED4365857.1 spore coat protein YutH [Schinkia azotoformans]
MIERDLYEQYRLNNSQFIKYRNFQAFYENGSLYVIVPIPEIEREELLELKQISDYLQFQKEDRIAHFVPTVTQELIGYINGESIALFKLPNINHRRRLFGDGEDLARLHQLGRYYPYPPQIATRLGLWKTMWENRLDQLEEWWGQRIQGLPENRFEKLFFETFPYYLGVSENAIQYVADCMWEDARKEAQIGTICYVKYKPQTDSDRVIFPTDLIFDHPTRDLAEWIRSKYVTGADMQEISSFLNQYERIMPLSIVSCRLLFGRLLFPLSYFEAVEGYYSASTEKRKMKYEKQFFRVLDQAEDYERFLSTFSKNFGGVSSRNLQIPEIEWLQGIKG